MTKEDQKSKVKVILVLNLFICLISGLVLFNVIESKVTWKIVAASIGFLGFVSLAILVYKKLIKLNKS